jgi:hypothetical protein
LVHDWLTTPNQVDRPNDERHTRKEVRQIGEGAEGVDHSEPMLLVNDELCHDGRQREQTEEEPSDCVVTPMSSPV